MKEKIYFIDKCSGKTEQERLALSYLTKYMKELQVHFNLSGDSLKRIAIKATSSIKSKSSMNKILNMLKSLW
ncbi:MAG: hypothetical protein E7Z91_01240 [Cyanobacteria bacterium SIG30]|nr:hypothetical protein [Cyanobacteria bacterium SIG30]